MITKQTSENIFMYRDWVVSTIATLLFIRLLIHGRASFCYADQSDFEKVGGAARIEFVIYFYQSDA